MLRPADGPREDAATEPLHVLVAVDGSEQGVRACEAIVHLLPPTAEVRFLTVVSYGMYPFSLADGEFSDERERLEAVRGTVRRTQAAARAVLEEAGFLIVEVWRYGFPPDEILYEIEEDSVDLVVLGHRALSGAARWLSSVSDRVVHNAKVPVLLVP